MWNTFLINFPDIIGLIGVLLVLVAYLLLTTNKMYALDISYQLLNFVGSILILSSLFFSWNLSCAIIEIAWILISSFGLYRAIKAQSIATSSPTED